ncbi:c-type cytochrome [Mesonia ostreae]|uniref:Photosynthetic reaction center cytochrome c subunit n=1 Tax=Mesonia ostreae TaxID=861110 RepID=A0ABU2KL01_9FLAO|nr:c-type cytochrome [Mesonia ostreae]MDT0295406.1 c-type cytochrome [Mesonia ostreae]
MKLKKKLLALSSAIGLLLVILGLFAFKTDLNSDRGYVVPNDSWENLKVLPQDISKDSLEFLMNNYATSLGVKCNYCPAVIKKDPTKLDFPSDAKIEKEIGREMIKMTNEINAIYFQRHFPDPKPEQVNVFNCVFCHRGTANPEKYLSQMGAMYKTYDPDRDNRKEKFQEEMGK